MADPGSILGGLKVASEAKRVGLDLFGGDDRVPQFGFGRPEAERLCKSLDVFLTAAGVASATRQRRQRAVGNAPPTGALDVPPRGACSTSA